MKHLKRYNESFKISRDIQDILNIARDASLPVDITEAVDRVYVYVGYTQSVKDNLFDANFIDMSPDITEKEFMDIILEIYHRLDTEGVVRPARKKDGIFVDKSSGYIASTSFNSAVISIPKGGLRRSWFFYKDDGVVNIDTPKGDIKYVKFVIYK